MATRIHKGYRGRLYLKEHREAKGVSAKRMAERLGIERESVYRLEREAMTRLRPDTQAQYAHALEIEPERLWRPPDEEDLNGIVADSPPETKALAADLLRRLVKKAS